MPPGLDGVAVVLQDGEPFTTPEVSPLTNPVMMAVGAGLAAPNSREALLAVTVSVAGVIVNDCWACWAAA